MHIAGYLAKQKTRYKSSRYAQERPSCKGGWDAGRWNNLKVMSKTKSSENAMK